MKKFWVPSLLLVTTLGLSCGSHQDRQLQSITISAVVNGSQANFVATGTFSAAPTTVTPLPVSWSLAESTAQYTLTTQPFSIACNALGPVTAMAPSDPNAPISGVVSSEKMVMATTPIPCP